MLSFSLSFTAFYFLWCRALGFIYVIVFLFFFWNKFTNQTAKDSLPFKSACTSSTPRLEIFCAPAMVSAADSAANIAKRQFMLPCLIASKHSRHVCVLFTPWVLCATQEVRLPDIPANQYQSVLRPPIIGRVFETHHRWVTPIICYNLGRNRNMQ